MNIIETNRLILRKYSPNDIPVLYNILSDPITMRFWPAPYSLEQTENWVQSNIESYRQFGFGRWPIILKETGEMIGDCGILIAEIDGQREHDLGYIIHHPFWRNGFAVEAAQACKDYAFQSLRINRLCANMPFDHLASIQVARNIGMEKEKEFFNKRNRNILTYLYAVSKEGAI
ncbi:GNAT family N-acetyltransferase [Heliobacterium undosum]|uniref:GNAT family N-acetyltransferase n=1 Tax=Heliomicrobium undosum TaxID=121734 RepID=A0A845LCV0_9FIRM|nr:GNAT family N-acetyltransferase [Heliomicrobium undosum]MZP31478.1 GNAT family N-acetyltransferase [Heliomicrobium undosum]